MEKHIQSLKSEINLQKTLACALLFLLGPLFCPALLSAQVPSVIQNIRIPLWAELDAYPVMAGEEDAGENQYDYPVKSLKETAPFIIGGMVYGWEFYYTPSDKQRNVEEILEVTENGIEYSSPWIQDNKLNAWCSYRRNESQVQNYYLWSSIQNPIVQGRGYGSVALGFEGLRVAANDALKNAVRAYYRNLIKNKPKAITGKVLIRDMPQIGIDAGRYVINLDFFLECGKIIEYKMY